jgi:hypothetical protein
MARMMPAFCPEAAPPGEKALYAALATSESSWSVLHSLAIADHVRQVEGEADFVIIVPRAGVLVVEVKSHRSVTLLDDGRWKLGNDPPTARGPFQQAKESMYSIREYLRQRHVDLRSIPMMSAVWFTHVRARSMLPVTPEWHEWQVLDSEDLANGASRAIHRTLAAGKQHLAEKVGGFAVRDDRPDDAAVERIAHQLRPRFEMHVVQGDLRRNRESQLLTFIEEQYLALDAMAENQTVFFTGPAGSGKTLLGIEAARRESGAARSGRVLCFNRLLGRHLSRELDGVAGLRVSTLHQELLRIADMQPPSDPDADFWERELVDLALEKLLDSGDELKSDFLILDEAQDIVRDPFVDVLDLMIHDGLESGRLLMFGDVEGQAIFGSADGRVLLRRRCSQMVSHRLTTNCRNLPRIGYVVNMFSQLDPGYTRFRRGDDGVDPTFFSYERGSDQSPRLVEAVRKLRDDGFDLNEIAVLSPLRSGSIAETTTDHWLRQVLAPADGSSPRPGRLQYSTIQAFKGLETAAVVVTDLDRNQVPNFEALLYVGLTRATDRLYAVIESESLRAAFGGAT